MIGILGFVILGLGAALALAGVPRVKRPAVDQALFEKATDVSARLACALCGAAPLTMLSVAYAGFAPLPRLLGFVVLPAYAAVLSLGLLLPNVGRRAVTGFLAGIVAVLAYDCTRLALSFSQGGKDPIPHIGIMLMGSGAPWWVGYLWRTLGNGAGLGVVFAMLCPRAWWRPLTGLLYASCVGIGMIVFLAAFPVAQTQLFRLTWQTLVNSVLGHGTYGLVLGLMCRAAVRRQARRPVKARHAVPDEVRAGRPDAAESPSASGPASSPGSAGGLAPTDGHRAYPPAGGEDWGASGPSWARPEDVPTDWLPRVPTVPPPAPRRQRRGAHSR